MGRSQINWLLKKKASSSKDLFVFGTVFFQFARSSNQCLAPPLYDLLRSDNR